MTLLNARLEDTPLPSTNDKIYVGAPKVKGNTLFEYSIPTVPGLVATFDWQFSGPRAADDTNSFFVAGYNLFDLGARYTSSILTQAGDLASVGGQPHRQALLVDGRAEQSDRRQHGKSAGTLRHAAHLAGGRELRFLETLGEPP